MSFTFFPFRANRCLSPARQGEAVAEEDEVEEREREKERDARRCSRRRVINDAR